MIKKFRIQTWIPRIQAPLDPLSPIPVPGSKFSKLPNSFFSLSWVNLPCSFTCSSWFLLWTFWYHLGSAPWVSYTNSDHPLLLLLQAVRGWRGGTPCPLQRIYFPSHKTECTTCYSSIPHLLLFLSLQETQKKKKKEKIRISEKIKNQKTKDQFRPKTQRIWAPWTPVY